MSKRKVLFLTLSVTLMLTLVAAGLFGQAVQKENLYRFLSIFTEVFSLARNNYVEDVRPDQLVDGAFSGVTDAIDEFSYYVAPAQMRDHGNFRDDDNTPGSAGIVVTKRFGYAYVIAPVAGSAAEEAGVEAGDFIERIDNIPTQRMAVWEVRKALQGQEGSKLELSLLRGGMSERETVTITRRDFKTGPLKVEHYGDTAYVKIPTFRPGTARQLRDSLSPLRGSELIVDVRGNAAGSVDEAILAADELLDSGMITSLSGRRVEARQWKADGSRAFSGDVLVLTDASTAGPGEVFAAALTGNKRGRTVGIATYGRAIQQRFVPLPSGGGLQITIGHYTTPDLRPIKEQGVRPDVPVDLAALAVREEDGKKPEEDLILNRALRLFGEVRTEKVAA